MPEAFVPRRVAPANTTLTPVDFGTSPGAILGESLHALGATAEHLLERRRQQDNQTVTTDAMNKLQEQTRLAQYGDPNDPETPGFLQTQGKDAVDRWKTTEEGLETSRQKLMENMTPEQQAAFQQQSQPFMNHALTAMRAHAGQQREVYQRQVFSASLENATHSAVANADDPEVLTHTMRNGLGQIRQYFAARGLTPDNPVVQNASQRWTDATLGNIVITKAHAGDATGAHDFLESNKRNLSPELYAQTMERIRPHFEDERATQAYQAVANPMQAIPDTVTADAVWARMMNLESGNRQLDAQGHPVSSAKGAIGAAQLLPETAKEVANKLGIAWDENKFRSDAVYNRALGQGYFHQLVDQFGGNLTLACAAYNAGPGRVEKWCQQFGDPRQGAVSNDAWLAQIPYKETHQYVGRTGAALSKTSITASHTAPDFVAQEAALAANPTLNDREKSLALSKVRQAQSLWTATTATARDRLHDQLSDLNVAFRNGNTQADIPEETIHQLLPEEAARKEIESLNLLRNGAIEADRLRYASPQEIAAADARDTQQLQGEDIEHYKTRLAVAKQRQAVINVMQRHMKEDPFAYVAEAPVLAPERTALQEAEASGDPERIQQAQSAFIQKNMALQTYMNPLAKPSVLTSDQAKSLVTRVLNPDLSKEDPRTALKAIREQYGPYYHQALGDLVKAGLPKTYLVMENMAEPAAEIFAGALKQGGGDAGKALKIFKQNNPEAQRDIDPPASQGPSTLVSRLQPLLDTFRAQGAPELGNTVVEAAKLQAYAYANKGVSNYVEQAAKDLMDRYDISGSLRAPKGTIKAVRNALDALQANPSRLDIAALPSANTALTDGDRQSLTRKRIASEGQWVTNQDESGYVLTLPSLYPGHRTIVKDSQGHPLEVRLKDILAGRYTEGYYYNQERQQENATKAWAQDQQAYDWSTAS